jgi:hypothetical protein
MLVIRRSAVCGSAAMPSAVSRLQSFDAEYAACGELPGRAQPSTSRLRGALRMTRGSWVSLVVRTTRPPSATAGSRSRASR